MQFIGEYFILTNHAVVATIRQNNAMLAVMVRTILFDQQVI